VLPHLRELFYAYVNSKPLGTWLRN